MSKRYIISCILIFVLSGASFCQGNIDVVLEDSNLLADVIVEETELMDSSEAVDTLQSDSLSIVDVAVTSSPENADSIKVDSVVFNSQPDTTNVEDIIHVVHKDLPAVVEKSDSLTLSSVEDERNAAPNSNSIHEELLEQIEHIQVAEETIETVDSISMADADQQLSEESPEVMAVKEPATVLAHEEIVSAAETEEVQENQETDEVVDAKPTDIEPPVRFVDSEIILRIKAVDSVSLEPVPAHIELKLYNSRRVANSIGSCDKWGKYSSLLTKNTEVEVVLNAESYIMTTLKIDINTEIPVDKVVEKVVKLKRLSTGSIVILNNINFKQGDHHLPNSSHHELDKLIKLMEVNPKMVILIGGHTDNTASKDASIQLSLKRVNEVRFYLVRNGIKANRIKVKGYGSTRPISHGTNPESQKLNRRVDFEVLKI